MDATEGWRIAPFMNVNYTVTGSVAAREAVDHAATVMHVWERVCRWWQPRGVNGLSRAGKT